MLTAELGELFNEVYTNPLRSLCVINLRRGPPDLPVEREPLSPVSVSSDGSLVCGAVKCHFRLLVTF